VNSKKFLAIPLFFVWLSSPLNAQEQTVNKDSIKALVSQVKKAPPSQRSALMNQLKIKLRSVNQETRKEVMIGLRRTFNKQGMHHTVNQMKRMHQQMQNSSMIHHDMPNMSGQNTPDHTPVRQMPMRGN